MNETCLILGDSIAVGLASVIKGCVVVAKVGMSSTWIMANAPTMQADRVYISSGSNDPDNPALSANLEHTRAKIAGVITWIEPVNARAASVVAAVAAKHGDRVVSFTPGLDNVHPKSYEALGTPSQGQPVHTVPERRTALSTLKGESAMKTSTMCFLSVPMLVAGSIALSGCGRSSSSSTNISYRQVGICKGYETPAGPITAAANEGFAVFKIESVDNTKYGSSFSLTPERLYVNQSTPAQAAGQVSNWNRRFVHRDPRFAQTMGFTSIPQTTIPAGEKLDINNVVIIPIGINNPSGGAEANQFSFELAYDSGTEERGNQQNVNEGIVFTKTNQPDTKWSVVQNCKELSFK